MFAAILVLLLVLGFTALFIEVDRQKIKRQEILRKFKEREEIKRTEWAAVNAELQEQTKKLRKLADQGYRIVLLSPEEQEIIEEYRGKGV